jgi:Rod binding domain-containing protein
MDAGLTAPMTNPPAAPALPAATPEQRAKIAKVAKDFEASFLQVMMGQMFDTVSTSSFGGGEGEAAFKSFLTDSFSKEMTAHGGIGLTHQLTREMLKMQGLSEPTPSQGAPA